MINEQRNEADRFMRLPPAKLRDWDRLRKAGLVRIATAEFLCEHNKWYKVKSSRNATGSDLATGEALAVVAARTARITRCPCKITQEDHLPTESV